MKKKPTKRPSQKKEPILNEVMQREFALFMQYHPPKEFARDLRNVIIDYSSHQMNGWSIYVNHSFMRGVLRLLNVLDEAGEQ